MIVQNKYNDGNCKKLGVDVSDNGSAISRLSVTCCTFRSLFMVVVCPTMA